jgi:lipopolysaccharide export system protein LptA
MLAMEGLPKRLGEGTWFRMSVTLLALASLTLSRATSAGDQFRAVGGDKLEIEAEKLEVDLASGTAVLTGNVNVAKGTLKVSCPKVEIKFDTSPKVSWLRGSGGVSADVKGVHGDAPEVEVDLQTQKLELRGGVKITRGQGTLKAEKATIDLPTSKVTLTQIKGSVPVPK